MTTTQQVRNATAGTGVGAIHLLITEGDVKMMVENPEQVMEEIEARATRVSSILEGILLEPHGVPRWGINE